MKWLPLLSSLPAAAVAFQQARATHRAATRSGTGLGFLPEKFRRAEQCATHYGTCWLDELEELASELEEFQSADGKSQGRDDYKDTKRVTDLLHAQIRLKQEMDDYVDEHHVETFDRVVDIWGPPPSGA